MSVLRFLLPGLSLAALCALSGCATTSSVERAPEHQACVRGDFDACLAFGRARLASPQTAGRRDALTAFTFACTHGHAPACAGLAELQGQRREDPRQVRDTLRKACDGGEQAACVEFANGLSRRQALPFYQAACDANVGAGCTALATAYSDAGVLGDYSSKSAALFEKACQLGHQPGCVGAGRAYLLGQGVGADPNKGLEFLQSTCTPDETAGCTLLARIFEEGIGVPVDLKRANTYYEIAAEQAPDETLSTPASAFVVYVDGCNHGDALGCFNAAVMQAEGAGVERNALNARDLFAQACQAGCEHACERQKSIRIRHSGKAKP